MNLRNALTATVTNTKKEDGGLRALYAKQTQQSPATVPSRTVDERTVELIEKTRKKGNVLYIVDRTGSRASTWRAAKEVQKDIFEKAGNNGHMQARMLHFGGNRMYDTGWQDDSRKIVGEMEASACEWGETQLEESISCAAESNIKPSIVVMIGDCCEESPPHVYDAARRLAQKGIKVFAFHEDSDYDREEVQKGETVYKAVAEITGGVFMKLKKDMPLADLCVSASVYAVGGEEELRKLASTSRAALEMTRQLKLLPPSPGGQNAAPHAR